MTNDNKKYYKYVKKNPFKLTNKIETMVDDDTFCQLNTISTDKAQTISETSREAFKEFIGKYLLSKNPA